MSNTAADSWRPSNVHFVLQTAKVCRSRYLGLEEWMAPALAGSAAHSSDPALQLRGTASTLHYWRCPRFLRVTGEGSGGLGSGQRTRHSARECYLHHPVLLCTARSCAAHVGASTAAHPHALLGRRNVLGCGLLNLSQRVQQDLCPAAQRCHLAVLLYTLDTALGPLFRPP